MQDFPTPALPITKNLKRKSEIAKVTLVENKTPKINNYLFLLFKVHKYLRKKTLEKQ